MCLRAAAINPKPRDPTEEILDPDDPPVDLAAVGFFLQAEFYASIRAALTSSPTTSSTSSSSSQPSTASTTQACL